MQLIASRFRLVLTALLMIPALAAEALSTRGDDLMREDGLDC
jgi:hypothetical protein